MGERHIGPDEQLTASPGRATVQTPDDPSGGVRIGGARSREPDVEAPAMRDLTIVVHRRGVVETRRGHGRARHREVLRPTDVSPLTRTGEWTWDRGIEVVHVHLTQERLTRTGREMYGRDVVEVRLHDITGADDPALHRTAIAIAQETATGGVGSALLVEALTTQLSVQILRAHADVVLRDTDAAECLTTRQEHLVRDYVTSRLDRRLTLDDLANAAGLSKFHFARRFRGSTGVTPHEFVLQHRVDRARLLLRRTDVPLPEVASTCGFADQSHMNRIFRKRLGTTPGTVRRER